MKKAIERLFLIAATSAALESCAPLQYSQYQNPNYGDPIEEASRGYYERIGRLNTEMSISTWQAVRGGILKIMSINSNGMSAGQFRTSVNEMGRNLLRDNYITAKQCADLCWELGNIWGRETYIINKQFQDLITELDDIYEKNATVKFQQEKALEDEMKDINAKNAEAKRLQEKALQDELNAISGGAAKPPSTTQPRR